MMNRTGMGRIRATFTSALLLICSSAVFAAEQSGNANQGTGANSSTKPGAEQMPLPPAPPTFLYIDQGKLHLTAGFNDVDGAGGAGLVPLAFVTGYGSRNSWGANAHYTTVNLDSFQLTAYGVAVGLFDRVELSFTQQNFEATHGALDGLNVKQDIVGLKVKLLGDAVYLQNSWLPQVSVGAQYRNHKGIHDAAAVGLPGLVSPTALGAKDDSGTDIYLSATKIFLGNSFVVDVNLRYTKANQLGLLGFGGDIGIGSGSPQTPGGWDVFQLRHHDHWAAISMRRPSHRQSARAAHDQYEARHDHMT
ncbi:MAG: DUF3034 family protein [Gammaproteobacteria bacterium]